MQTPMEYQYIDKRNGEPGLCVLTFQSNVEPVVYRNYVCMDTKLLMWVPYMHLEYKNVSEPVFAHI